MIERDVERQLAADLMERDRGRAPESLRDRILAIPVVEPWWPRARVRAGGRRSHRTILAAAALLVAIGGSIVVLGGGSGPPLPGASESPRAFPLASPTRAPARTSDLFPPQTLVSWPADQAVSGALPPGTYALPKPFGVSDYVRVVLTLPAGWSFTDDLLQRRVSGADRLAIDLSQVEFIHPDPCHWDRGDRQPFTHLHPAQGPTTIDTPALLAQLDAGVPPVEVHLDGADGLLLLMTVPAEIDLASCDGGKYVRWTSSRQPADEHVRSVPGETDIVYFVDVDRAALFVRGSAGPSASAQDVAELRAILESMVVMR